MRMFRRASRLVRASNRRLLGCFSVLLRHGHSAMFLGLLPFRYFPVSRRSRSLLTTTSAEPGSGAQSNVHGVGREPEGKYLESCRSKKVPISPTLLSGER